MITEFDSSVLAVFVVVFLSVYYKFRKTKEYLLPNGPKGFPILGNALELRSNVHTKFSHWANLYGPLYTINIFGQKGLVISDLRLMKQAYGTLESTGKNINDPLGVLYEETYGISNAVGLHAIEQRKFFLRTLKQISSIKGKSSHESIMLTNCQQIVDKILETLKDTDLVDIASLFHHATSTAMWTIVKGDAPVDIKENSEMPNFINLVLKDLDAAGKSGLPVIPFLKKLGFVPSAYRKLEQSSKRMRDLLIENFVARRKLDSTNEDTDIFKPYINAVESCTDIMSSFYGKSGWRHCYNTFMGLLLGSAETTSTALTWIIFQMSAHPACQMKIKQEIDTIVGNGLPNLSHRPLMPYLEAVVLETLRISSLVPLGLWHVLLDNVNFEGYKLPKGLFLIPNINHIHNDPSIWGDPEIFRPERFLNRNNETQQLSLNHMKHNVVAFQVGRRSCPGYSLAKDILFLFTAVLLQRLVFAPDPALDQEEFFKSTGGFILKPAAKLVHVQRRIPCG